MAEVKVRVVRFYPALDIMLLWELISTGLESALDRDKIHQNILQALASARPGCYVSVRAWKGRLQTLQEAHAKEEMNSLRA